MSAYHKLTFISLFVLQTEKELLGGVVVLTFDGPKTDETGEDGDDLWARYM